VFRGGRESSDLIAGADTRDIIGSAEVVVESG
jgi:hypothetical protein